LGVLPCAKITKKLGDKLISMVSDYLKPKYFYSQASLSQQYFLENLEYSMALPNKEILQFALNSYQGGRFETFKRGYFNKGFIQDIKSAYPFHNINIPDVNKGIWKNTKEYDSEALIGLFNINVDIHDINVSPIKYTLNNNRLIYPIGKFKNIFVNKKELELINDLGYKYKINNGYNYYDNEPRYPYKFLQKFYDLKEKYKTEGKDELSLIPKIILNGFYGKTIQMTPDLKIKKEKDGDDRLFDVIEENNKLIYVYKLHKAGRIFNPIVANEITANTRVQLFKSCIKNLDNVIGFQTDSIITDKRLNLNYGNNMGDWEMENSGELIILGSGVYQIISDKPKVRLRGFNKQLDLYSILSDNPYEKKVAINVNRNMKMKRTMKMKTYDDFLIDDTKRLELFNKIVNEIKSININFDKKRIWERDFENCNDVLTNQINSKPIII
jgi:hypothetical protein